MSESTPVYGLPYLGKDDTLKEAADVAASSAAAIEGELVRLDDRITNEKTSVIASGTGSTKNFKITRKWDGNPAGNAHCPAGTFNFSPSGTQSFSIASKNDAGEHEIAYHQLLEDKYGLPDVPGFGSIKAYCHILVTDSTGKTWTSPGTEVIFWGLDDDRSDHSGHVYFQNTGFGYGDDSGAKSTKVPGPTVPDEEYTFEVIFLGELLEPEEEDKPEITQRVPWDLAPGGFDITCKINGWRIDTDYDHTIENYMAGTVKHYCSGTPDSNMGYDYLQQTWCLNVWPTGSTQNEDPFYPGLEFQNMIWNRMIKDAANSERAYRVGYSVEGHLLLWRQSDINNDEEPTEWHPRAAPQFYMDSNASQAWITFTTTLEGDKLSKSPPGLSNKTWKFGDNQNIRIMFIPTSI